MNQFLTIARAFFTHIFTGFAFAYRHLERLVVDGAHRRRVWFNIKVTIFTVVVTIFGILFAFDVNGFRGKLQDFIVTVLAIIIVVIVAKTFFFRSHKKKH